MTAVMPAARDVRYTAERCDRASAVCLLIESVRESISASMASAQEATSPFASA